MKYLVIILMCKDMYNKVVTSVSSIRSMSIKFP